MKRSVILATGIAASLASGVLAQNQVHISDPGLTYRQNNGGGTGGGPFRATWVAGDIGNTGGFGGTANSFLTFCLELTEHVAMDHTYYAQVNPGAINGGVAGGNPDPISAATSALYRAYRSQTNVFDGSSANPINTPVEATSLQLAIWFLEDEMSAPIGDPNYALSQQYLGYYNSNARAQAYVSWANSNATNIGGVKALTLWNSYNASTGVYSGLRQDMLTIVPLPPAAWAGMASLAGIGAFGYMRRRSFRA